MRLRTVAATLTLAAALAGCSGDGDDTGTPAPPASSAPAATATYVATMQATVDTNGSGCDTKKNGPGDCWLPLYDTMEQVGDPLNMTLSCKDKQIACWPQPGDKVEVNCLGTSDGLLWYGVTMPTDKVRGKGLASGAKVIGYNKVQWLRLSGKASQLRECQPA